MRLHVQAVANGFCLRDKDLKTWFVHASLTRRIAWTMEDGRHQIVPSWSMAYGRDMVSEEQLGSIDRCNLYPTRCADVELMRLALANCRTFEEDAEVQGRPPPPGVPVNSEVDELSLAEARVFGATGEWPMRVRLAREFPHLEGRVYDGHCVVLDLQGSFPGGLAEKVSSVMAAAGYSLKPCIYSIGKVHDEKGFTAAGFVHLTSLAMQPKERLRDLTQMDLTAYLDTSYVNWCERALVQLAVPSGTPLEVTLSELVRAMGCEMRAFHGVISCDSLRTTVEASTICPPEATRDEHAVFTHSVIVRIVEGEGEAGQPAAAGAPATEAAPAETEATEAATSESGRTPIHQRHFRSMDSLCRILDEDREADEAERMQEGPPTPAAGAGAEMAAGDADGLPRTHHLVVAWRNGAAEAPGRVQPVLSTGETPDFRRHARAQAAARRRAEIERQTNTPGPPILEAGDEDSYDPAWQDPVRLSGLVRMAAQGLPPQPM